MRHKDRTLTEAAVALDVVNHQIVEAIIGHGQVEPVKDGDLTLGQIGSVITKLGRDNYDRIRAASKVTVTFGNDDSAEVRLERVSRQLIHGMFVDCAEQIGNIAKWNRKLGGVFTAVQLESAYETRPVWPTHSPLTVAVLVPYLETAGQTFEALWLIAGRHNPYRYDGLWSDPDKLRYLGEVAHVPGLRWEVIDLAANWDKKDGIAPATVRDPKTSPHAGILAAAAHFPKWVRKMDGMNVPYVWIPGYQATIPGSQPWTFVRFLGFVRGDRRVELGADHELGQHSCYAVPAFRE